MQLRTGSYPSPTPADTGRLSCQHRSGAHEPLVGSTVQQQFTLYRIVITRMSSYPLTRACVDWRGKEGLSKKEIIRCPMGGLSVVRPARAVVPRSRRGMAALQL